METFDQSEHDPKICYHGTAGGMSPGSTAFSPLQATAGLASLADIFTIWPRFCLWPPLRSLVSGYQYKYIYIASMQRTRYGSVQFLFSTRKMCKFSRTSFLTEEKRLHFYSLVLLKQARLIKYLKSSIKSPVWLIHFKHVWGGEGGGGVGLEREGGPGTRGRADSVCEGSFINLEKLKRGNPF